MKNILVIVDLQNGFTRCEQTQNVKAKILKLLQKNIFDVVIGTKFLNEPNSTYERLLGWGKLEENGERQICKDIEKHMDYICEKYIYNCCNDNFFQRLYQLNDGASPEKVFVVGVDTDCCVLTIATGLFEHNIRPIVLSKYCASNGGDDSHRAGILCMSRLIGKNQIYDGDIDSPKDLDSL